MLNKCSRHTQKMNQAVNTKPAGEFYQQLGINKCLSKGISTFTEQLSSNKWQPFIRADSDADTNRLKQMVKWKKTFISPRRRLKLNRKMQRKWTGDIKELAACWRRLKAQEKTCQVTDEHKQKNSLSNAVFRPCGDYCNFPVSNL